MTSHNDFKKSCKKFQLEFSEEYCNYTWGRNIGLAESQNSVQHCTLLNNSEYLWYTYAYFIQSVFHYLMKEGKEKESFYSHVYLIIPVSTLREPLGATSALLE